VVELFPLESSEVTVRCGQRQAGGGGAGSCRSNTLSVQAGESFEVVVAIKSRFGLVAGGELVEQMMQEIVILPRHLVVLTGKSHFASATGVATFPVSICKAGTLEISAAVRHKGELCTIGGGGVVITVGPGVLKLNKLLVKKEAEVGEEVELVVVPDSTDVFGNNCQLSHGTAILRRAALAESLLSSFGADLRLEGDWSHEDSAAVPLRLMQPASLRKTEHGVVVGVLDLRLPGTHTFRIRAYRVLCCTQVVTAQVRIVSAIPHSLRYEAYCQPHVLLHRRWGCKAQVLNVRGQEMKIRAEDLTVTICNTANGVSLPLKVRSTPRIEFVQGCSLANHDSENEVTDLDIFLSETENPAHRGTYKLHAYAAGMSLCMHAEIRLDEPIDPATWSSEDLAENLRQARFEVHGTTGDVLKDEFGAELSGRNLIGKVDDKYETLKDCLLQDKKFADREEKAHVCGRIKEYVKSLNERHTIFGLGKGRFKSSVAKCISETDDLVLDPESFNKGGTAEIFRGHYLGSSVAVKIPLFNKGLKVGDDDTLAVMQEVQRELATTKDCSHQNVVQIHGLMVGPGRIGIVMEYCDMSLAKHIENRVKTLEPVNWGEAVRFLIDASTGLAFIHKHKRTTHGDVKPDNLLIQQGRLKVSDFGLATVHHTMTKSTGQVVRKGTSYFMAPEILLGNDPNANASPIDVWGLGCVISNVVTGKTPFAFAKSQLELETAMRQKKSVYLKDDLAGAPKKLVDLIDKCCQHEPRQRPNMEEIEKELRSILKSIQTEDGFALPAPWLERGCSLDDSSWKMLPCNASSKDFQIIKKRIESEMGGHGTLLKVEMNVNVDLFRCYDSERHRISQENGGDANEMWMWHATQRSREDIILQRGFDINYCGLDYEYYGAGIYLAPDSKLSNEYAASSRNTEYPSTRSMFLVRVACGRVFDKRHPLKLHPEFQKMLLLQARQNLPMDQQKDKFRELLRKPENRSCPPGWHSQLGHDISGERKSGTELVINRSCQAFPAYRISYCLARALPKALSNEGQASLRTFDDLKGSDFERSMIFNNIHALPIPKEVARCLPVVLLAPL
jgi:serine/threonine protein kinase